MPKVPSPIRSALSTLTLLLSCAAGSMANGHNATPGTANSAAECLADTGRSTASTRVQQAGAVLAEDWEHQLRVRRDPESKATAEALWLMSHPGADPTAALRRLQDLALTGSSAYVLALTTEHTCSRERQECAALAARWQAIEPNNLAALWWPQPHATAGDLAYQQQLQRLSAATRHSDAHTEFLRRLGSLTPTGGDGLGGSAESQLILDLGSMRPDRTVQAELLRYCRHPAAGEQSIRLCHQMADTLWKVTATGHVHRELALALARAGAPAQTTPAEKKLWAQRSLERQAGRRCDAPSLPPAQSASR